MDEPPANQARHPSPLRWAGAGMIGGASIVGMLWSILGRAPLPLAPAGLGNDVSDSYDRLIALHHAVSTK